MRWALCCAALALVLLFLSPMILSLYLATWIADRLPGNPDDLDER